MGKNFDSGQTCQNIIMTGSASLAPSKHFLSYRIIKVKTDYGWWMWTLTLPTGRDQNLFPLLSCRGLAGAAGQQSGKFGLHCFMTQNLNLSSHASVKPSDDRHSLNISFLFW